MGYVGTRASIMHPPCRAGRLRYSVPRRYSMARYWKSPPEHPFSLDALYSFRFAPPKRGLSEYLPRQSTFLILSNTDCHAACACVLLFVVYKIHLSTLQKVCQVGTGPSRIPILALLFHRLFHQLQRTRGIFARKTISFF